MMLRKLICVLRAVLLLAALPGVRALGQSASISAGDVLEMTVFQEPEMTTKTRVSPNGTITVPLIGSVNVSGKSAETAAQYIRERLMKGYFVNPQVTVTVLEFIKRQFTVLGQVQKGGTFEFPEGQTSMDLLAAIGAAGGYTRIADPKKVVIKRVRAGKEEVARVDARAIAAGAASSITIYPGDTITVGESIF